MDGVTRQYFEAELEANLQRLHAQVLSGAYRALPVRRQYIPEPNGKQRPRGIAALEDKIVQRAVVEVLNAIYEEDFIGFSYGFRPGRSQHDAMDALSVAIDRTPVNWILGADIRNFFDALSQDWLVRFLEHRIGDQRIIRLVRKWLKAGVLEDGELSVTETGTQVRRRVQWLRRCSRTCTCTTPSISGPSVGDAKKPKAMSSSCDTPMTSLPASNTRLMQGTSGTRCERGWRSSSLRCIRTRRGCWSLAAMQRADESGTALDGGRHSPFWVSFLSAGALAAVPSCFNGSLAGIECGRSSGRSRTISAGAGMSRFRSRGKWLKRVVKEYFAYHAVPTNFRALSAFRHHVEVLWMRALRRRSQIESRLIQFMAPAPSHTSSVAEPAICRQTPE